jgi:flagellar hook protein FlgE
MLRSLFSGISGLRAHQQMLDVTSNNIANVNSVGFKASQTVFEDTLSQMMRAAGAPQNNVNGSQGGTNPAQVGLGVRMSQITTNFLQGSAQTTGRPTDLMISGDGFFVVKSVNEQLFTRAGAFNFDAEGKLVTATGAAVQGWPAVNGAVNTNGQLGDIQLPVGTLIAPKATQNVTISGNLPADAKLNTQIPRTIKTYDSQGNAVTLTALFEQIGVLPSSYQLTLSDNATPPNTGSAVPLVFADATTATAQNPVGTLLSPLTTTLGGVTVDLAGLTNYTGNTTVNILSQDGAPAATLQSFSINPDGQLVGVFSNGLKQTVAQVAMANFNNPPGLEKTGDALYRFTVNSGLPQVGVAGTGGLGIIESGTVEMSNVDLAQEFTNLIVAQRGFQANSKVISTSDELLQDLVNLKR